MQRRTFLTQVSLGAATLATSALETPSLAASQTSRSVNRRSTSDLAEPGFRPLPLGAIRPMGWLDRQLRIQAQGLSGHLDEFWPDVAQSKWFGGQAEGWERAPYWLDGAIPLAWLIQDRSLQDRIRKHVDHIVTHQRSDGWFAPMPTDAGARRYDLWAILLINKALAQYHEATGEDRVLQSILRSLRALQASLDQAPLFDWGRFRWFEGLIPLYYAYEHTGEEWLIALGRKLHAQGFDYRAYYAAEDVTSPTPRRGLWTWEKHVVNTAMALKAGALAWRLSRDEKDRDFHRHMWEVLDRYHGQVTGMFTGDECLAGKNPTQGTELCAVVEAMYSLEQILAITADASMGDRLERIAFNALPATFAPDMWSHQYVQQVNQVQCTVNPDSMWSTNGPESNLFGLEPNYGCCTANMHQGWPKFAAHLWMQSGDDGVAVVAYAPSRAECEVRGKKVQLTLETDYPFRETLRITVRTDGGAASFPLWLRVPSWTSSATARIPGSDPVPLKPGGFHRLERDWSGTTVVDIRFPMNAKTSRRYNRAITVERGPLVYSLGIREKRTRIHEDLPHRELPHGDFEVRPASAWNYALVMDPAHPEKSLRFEEREVGERPFSPEGAGMLAKTQAKQLPSWKLAHGWAEEVPPIVPKTESPLEDVSLIPYGCTNLRVTEFPCIDPTQSDGSAQGGA